MIIRTYVVRRGELIPCRFYVRVYLVGDQADPRGWRKAVLQTDNRGVLEVNVFELFSLSEEENPDAAFIVEASPTEDFCESEVYGGVIPVEWGKKFPPNADIPFATGF